MGSFFSSCSSTKTFHGKGKAINSFKELSLNENHFSGIVIRNLESDEVLIAKNEKKIFTPASNTKLLTFYIADLIIPDSIPSIKYCYSNDTLFFSGLGDPTFLHPDFPFQPAYDFLNNAPAPTAYSQEVKVDERFGPGWAWDDYPYYFQQEKSTFPIYGNSLWIKKDSVNENYEIVPPYLKTKVSVEKVNDNRFSISRNEYANLFELKYENIPQEIEKVVPLHMSDSLVINLLSDTLNRKIMSGKMPEHYSSKSIIYSYPKDSLFKKLLVESDNFIAEQLLLSSGVCLFDTLSSGRVIDFAMEHHFPEWSDKINWVDGSGLSRYNMMTPEFLIDLLEKIYAKSSMDRIKSLFPNGGKEGTLKNFLQTNEAFVFAKSGSMTGVYNLSGYLITDKGNTLAFSIMNNNFNIPFKELKKEIESYLLFIKNHY